MMKTFTLFSFPIWGFLVISSATEQKILSGSANSPLHDDFSRIVNETLQLWHVPGVSIAVVDGDVTWSEGYGIAIFPDTPVTPSTLFYAGSTTKAFVAAAMSLLVDDNEKYPQVQWKTPISELIRDDFVLEDEYATSHITIEDALSHRTGMPRHDYSYGGFYDGHKGTPRDLVRSLRYLPLTAEPRTRFQYCNMMFVVISHVIETLESTWLGDFLRKRIWKPLGMTSTYFSQSAAENAPETQAQGYVYYQDKYQDVPFMDLDIVSGAGSVVSNVLDYSKWLKAMIDSSGPISTDSHRQLRTGRTLLELDPRLPSPFTGPLIYTLGWITGAYGGYQFYYHSGGMEGFGAELIFFPALKYGITTFGNTAVTSNLAGSILMFYLVDQKLKTPLSERFDWSTESQMRFIQFDRSDTPSFYPDLPSPRLPPTLPLANYTGTYHHPGYQNITIFLKDGALAANRTDITWKIALEFEHMSGDFFMAHIDSTTAPGFAFQQATAAEFHVGANGIPKTFGLAAEPEMGLSGRIFFDRISGSGTDL